MRKNKEKNQEKQKKIKVMHIGTHRKLTTFLWVLLIFSIAFGVYNNFTAVDTRTVVEKKIVEKRIVDTNKIESFVKNFASTYYEWKPTETSLSGRTEALKDFITDELQLLNQDVISKEIPTSSIVQDIQIWCVEQLDDNNFKVVFKVKQSISESKQVNKKVTTKSGKKKNVTVMKKDTRIINSVYETKVYVDEQEDLVIVKNPTISSTSIKSNYKPTALQSNGMIDSDTKDEVTEFLTSFFALYPTATEKEISYYAKNKVMKPIQKEYIFAELINPVFNKKGKQISADISVKYLDNDTKATQISQFHVILEKEESGNWLIVK